MLQESVWRSVRMIRMRLLMCIDVGVIVPQLRIYLVLCCLRINKIGDVCLTVRLHRPMPASLIEFAIIFVLISPMLPLWLLPNITQFKEKTQDVFLNVLIMLHSGCSAT